MRHFAVVACLSLTALPAYTETFTGHVIAVLDGDTITLLDTSNQQHRLRLAEVDAPEIGHGRNSPSQPFGQQSKQSLSGLTYDREITAECPNTDRYGRYVCKVYADGLYVNAEQVARGFAWVYRQYAPKTSSLYQIETRARTSGLGLWQDRAPIPPWNWRHASGDATL